MDEASFTTVIITAFLSSGIVTAFFSLISKKLVSPESKNELARLGNEFAQQLLRDAKAEREELRLTIRELEHSVSIKHETIERLEHLAREKDSTIRELESRQLALAKKLQEGVTITLQDVFGPKAPKEFAITTEEAV